MADRPPQPRSRQLPARRGHLAQLAHRPGAGALRAELTDQAQRDQALQAPVDLRAGDLPDRAQYGAAAELGGDGKAVRGLLGRDAQHQPLRQRQLRLRRITHLPRLRLRTGSPSARAGRASGSRPDLPEPTATISSGSLRRRAPIFGTCEAPDSGWGRSGRENERRHDDRAHRAGRGRQATRRGIAAWSEGFELNAAWFQAGKTWNQAAFVPEPGLVSARSPRIRRCPSCPAGPGRPPAGCIRWPSRRRFRRGRAGRRSSHPSGAS
jgi:hypothetical protein